MQQECQAYCQHGQPGAGGQDRGKEDTEPEELPVDLMSGVEDIQELTGNALQKLCVCGCVHVCVCVCVCVCVTRALKFAQATTVGTCIVY